MFILNKEEKYATGLVKPKTTAIFFDKLLVTDDLLDSRLSKLGYTDIPKEILLRPNLRKNFFHDVSHFAMDMGLQEQFNENIYSLFEDQPQTFKYSMHRNHRIYEAIEFYQKLGINIIPIYFSPTDYEQHFLPSDNNDNNLLSPTISICINKIPEIIEEKLTWEQVVNIREDKESLAKVRRFNNWITLELTNKNEAEIEIILEKNLDDYSFAGTP